MGNLIRMNIKWTQYLIWLVLFVPLSLLARVPERPMPQRLVNDLAGILTPQQVMDLEDQLVQFGRKSSTQITVVTVNSLEGYDPAGFAYEIGESWGVGQKGKNNGVVVLVKPKTPGESGKVYIAVGYGLEGVIPDAVANRRIIDQEMIPRFKENDYYGGIVNGTRVVMELVGGEYSADEYAGQSSGAAGGGFIVLLIVLIIVISMMKGGNTKSFNAGSRSLPFWIWLGMLNSGKSGGSWSDFSGGRGGFGGGGGGGGFGGFGGGSFGGGGAGGSW